jgi:transcription antitermination factor NusG
MATELRKFTEPFEQMIARKKHMSGNKPRWYAVRCIPGSQKPKREYKTESTTLDRKGKPRGKGYRIVPKMNYDLSMVERALEAAGFAYYMPAEKRLIRDRRHTDLWKIRRFALMVGYVFVRDPEDWGKLAETEGVLGIVRDADGRELPIDIMEIMAIRAIEAKTEVKFDDASKEARKRLRKKAKEDPRLKMLISKLDTAGTITVPLNEGILAA